MPLNRPVKLHWLTIIIRYVFSEHDKFYPQLFLDDALYELLQYQKIDASEEMDVNQAIESEKCELCHYWLF